MSETPPQDRARTPLLTLITMESLDEDYRHVADRRAAAGTIADRSRRPHLVAMAVVAAFGLLATVAALQTSASAGVDSANRNSLLRQIEERREEATGLQRSVQQLRELTVRLQERHDEAGRSERVAATRVERLAALTGFGPVTGPGVVITVDDAPNGEAVRDTDLALLVNGLWAAGAEAISINGKRLTVRSALRNSGVAINLNGPPPLSPPYVVSAIGENKTLQADLLDTETGLAFSSLADALGLRVQRENVEEITLPAATQRQLRLRSAVSGTAQENLARQRKETGP